MWQGTKLAAREGTLRVASRTSLYGRYLASSRIDPIFLGTYEQFLRNPGGIRDPEDSQGEFLALSGAPVVPATWDGLSSERPVRPPDIARVCAIMMIESDGKDLGVMGLR